MATYDSGWTGMDYLNSQGAMSNSGQRIWTLPNGETTTDPLVFMNSSPRHLRNLEAMGITSAEQLGQQIPDALPGSLMPSGNDLAGTFLAVAPIAMMLGGAAGVGGLSNAGFGAGTGVATDTLGAIGAGTEAGGGFGAGTAAGATGGAGSTIGDLFTSTPPGSGTALQTVTNSAEAPWGVNLNAPQSGTNLVYDAATGEFVPATGGAGGGGGAGSGLVFDSATGQVVQGAAGAAGAGAAAAGAAGAAAGTGLNAAGAGLFGMTPLQTMMAGSTLGSLIQGGTALLGANTQADAAQRATDAQVGMFNTLNAQGAPYRAAGYQALGTMTSPESQAYFNKQFGPADLQAGLAPGYEFMLDQGLRATRNAANAQTGLLSGNTLQGINNYAQQYALNQGYQPSFNNFESQRTGIFNRLSAIAGLGQTANAQSSQAGAAISPGIAQSTQNYGTALGGGFVGAGNALAGGLNNAASWYALPAILGRG